MQPLLRAVNLKKAFRGREVLRGLDLSVPQGSVYGLLGLNGAGKTTTLRVLTGLVRPDSGHVELAGRAILRAEDRSGIAALVDAPSFVPALSARDNVLGHARLHGRVHPQCEAVLRRLGLDPSDRRPVRQFSLGMKQRLAISMALSTEPQLLVLDEPMNGLDPAGMVELRQLLPALAKESGVTVLLSSHLLDEVEQCCSHVGILQDGVIKLEASLKEILQQAGWSIRAKDHAQLLRVAAQVFPDARLSASAAGCTLTAPHLNPERVLASLIEAGVQVTEFSKVSPLESLLLTPSTTP
jgi:ABC-2 type transport system ATP-binding protein